MELTYALIGYALGLFACLLWYRTERRLLSTLDDYTACLQDLRNTLLCLAKARRVQSKDEANQVIDEHWAKYTKAKIVQPKAK